MSFDSGGKGGSDGGKAKKGGFLDGLRSFGADFANAFARNMGASTEQRSTKPSVDRRDPVAVRDRPIAARQIQRRLKIERKAADEDAGKQDALEPQAAEEQLEEQRVAGGVDAAEQDASDATDEVSADSAEAEQDAPAVDEKKKDGDEGQGSTASEDKPSMSVAAKLKGVHRKILRTANAPPAAAQGSAPATPTDKVAFEPQTTNAGTEKLELKAGSAGPAQLLVGGKEGTTALKPILDAFSDAINRAGEKAVQAAMTVVNSANESAAQVIVADGKVEKAKQDAAKAKLTEAATAVNTLLGQLKASSLEVAKTVIPAAMQTVDFKRPDPKKWKTPYISKFNDEMDRQLLKQQEGLKGLTVDAWVANRETFSPTSILNDLDESAKQEVLLRLQQRCEEGLPRAEKRLEVVTKQKQVLIAGQMALNRVGATAAEIKAGLEATAKAVAEQKDLASQIQGFIDAAVQIQQGQKGGKMDPSKMQEPGGREDAQSTWAETHSAAKAALVKMLEDKDVMVEEWQGIVTSTKDLAVLHDPDQIAGGEGDIPDFPVVPEPEDKSAANKEAVDKWREYLEKVKSHLGVQKINGSLGSQWKERIDDLYTKVTTDAELPQEVHPLRKMNVTFVAK